MLRKCTHWEKFGFPLTNCWRQFFGGGTVYQNEKYFFASLATLLFIKGNCNFQMQLSRSLGNWAVIKYTFSIKLDLLYPFQFESAWYLSPESQNETLLTHANLSWKFRWYTVLRYRKWRRDLRTNAKNDLHSNLIQWSLIYIWIQNCRMSNNVELEIYW